MVGSGCSNCILWRKERKGCLLGKEHGFDERIQGLLSHIINQDSRVRFFREAHNLQSSSWNSALGSGRLFCIRGRGVQCQVPRDGISYHYSRRKFVDAIIQGGIPSIWSCLIIKEKFRLFAAV